MTDGGFDHLPLTGWFPGHMLKTGRALQEVLRLVDLVVELVDARAPAMTRNPRLLTSVRGKPLVVLATKADLADPVRTAVWEAWFTAAGLPFQTLDGFQDRQPLHLAQEWTALVGRERRRRGATRPLTRPVRVMVVGIPNVGKSTLVNRMLTRRRAAVGPKPGVTRHTQWVPLAGDMELLDTPGVLWPQIRSKSHELELALLGAIPDELIGVELMAEYLWLRLREQPAGAVAWSTYGLGSPPESPEEMTAAVARRRGLLRAGGVVDTERAGTAVIKDFREGRLGRLTLDLPSAAPEPA